MAPHFVQYLLICFYVSNRLALRIHFAGLRISRANKYEARVEMF